jgi:hypothetical protein
MSHHGSLDNSERLRISSLVDMSAEEEDMYDVCATASDLVDAMRLRFMETQTWLLMIHIAFTNTNVAALNKIIGLMREKIQNYDANQGGPAPAAPPSLLVPAPAPTANAAPAVNSVDPAASLPFHSPRLLRRSLQTLHASVVAHTAPEARGSRCIQISSPNSRNLLSNTDKLSSSVLGL